MFLFLFAVELMSRANVLQFTTWGPEVICCPLIHQKWHVLLMLTECLHMMMFTDVLKDVKLDTNM